jgi:hypothetical protein
MFKDFSPTLSTLQKQLVRFGVFKAVSMMWMVLLVSAPCSFVRECQIFRRTYCHNLQCWSNWFIMIGDYIYIRTAATNWPIFHPASNMWAWTAMIMMMPTGNNSWLVHESSLTVHPAESAGTSRSENFAYQYLKYFNGTLTCTKSYDMGPSRFTSHPKDADFYWPWKSIASAGFEPVTFGSSDKHTNHYTTEVTRAEVTNFIL